jgi:molybdopterin-binding protein
MKLSARNVLKGKVVSVVRGAVNAEVTVALKGGQQVVSIITLGSLDSLGIRKGRSVYAVVKASSVMLGVDH